jgi:hypothetical protein
MENKTIFEWAEMFQEQIQAGASQSDIIQLLKEYENQALRIHGVVGRSEQFSCYLEDSEQGERCCEQCGDCKEYKGECN